MTETTPYHYTGIVRELSYTLEHVLNASDYHEGVVDPTFTLAFKESQQLGNLKMALGRLKGAFEALSARYHDLHTSVTLRESSQTSPSAMAELERYAADHPVGERREP